MATRCAFPALSARYGIGFLRNKNKFLRNVSRQFIDDCKEPGQPLGNKKAKWMSAEEAVCVVKSGDTVFVQGAAATPRVLVPVLAEHGKKAGLKNVTVCHIHTEGAAEYNKPEYQGIFRSNSFFVGANCREPINSGRADFLPVFLSEIPLLFHRKLVPVDVALLQVTPADSHGYCSLGTSVDCTRAALQHAKYVIGQVNPRLPRTFGDATVHVSHFDALVEGERDLPEHKPDILTDVELSIGKLIAENLVENGATMQMGIGSIPDAVLSSLKNHKDLGIHSEMFSDGVVDLVNIGCINNKYKTLHAGKIVGSFTIGTKKLFDFMDNNPFIVMLNVDYVNHTDNIAIQPKMTAINSCIEVDLTGQVCSDSIGTRIYSGVGGQIDFLRGAAMGKDGKGKAVLAMPSSTGKGESKIVPFIKQDIIDHPMRDAHVVEISSSSPKRRRRKLLGSGKINQESVVYENEQQREEQLSVFEKKFLLCAERGDIAAIRNLLEKHKNNSRFDINCRDAVGRTALVVAIENENMELIDLLLRHCIDAGDALLHAISEEYVEAVEVLLHHEEKTYEPEKPYSWETVDHDMAMFTKDVTPLVLAAHRDNYEIIKLLLDRGATLPMPHDVRCGCDDCVRATKEDCLRHSRSRINAYKALSSPSLICLSSTDPILTAFKLSSELRRLSSAEHEFKQEYTDLRRMCEEYGKDLLDHTRTSYELEIMLNYDPENPVSEPGRRMKLERLKLAIASKQKTFIAHPNVQQLLATVWYEGSPGFRRKGAFRQFLEISRIGALFPVYSISYMVAPKSSLGQTMTKPFTKFICHSASYCFFLLLLILASQRVENLLMKWIGTEYLRERARLEDVQERGKPPGIVESTIILYVFGFVWSEIKQLWDAGLEGYLSDMWNIADFFTNMLYLSCIGLRFSAFYIVQRELASGLDAYRPREQWDPYDPMLISEGLFGAANIFSFLKMVHIFSVNPHLGPLQISLGRMVFDIVKFFFIYSLVLFAFACGLNQLLWYYADIDKQLCYSGPDGQQNPSYPDSCLIWRRFANLFETSQSLFWASFGLVELENFELTGIKSYTRFWSLLMYGSYSVINIVVLLNLLIAMMSNSYQIISERSDVEWKFARSKLWMSYFESGSTVPPPFNIFPTLKSIRKLFGCTTETASIEVKEKSENDFEYRMVMRCLVRRYVTTQQRKAEETGVTEDDVNEVKQAVNSFRSELFEALRNNGMKCASSATEPLSRKEKIRERRLLKDFNIDLVETVMEALMKDKERTNKLNLVRRVTRKKTNARRNWNAMVQAARACHDPIGSGTPITADSLADLRRQVLQEKETMPMTGARRFAFIAKKAREMDRRQASSEKYSALPGFKDASDISTQPVPEDNEDTPKRHRSIKLEKLEKTNLQMDRSPPSSSTPKPTSRTGRGPSTSDAPESRLNPEEHENPRIEVTDTTPPKTRREASAKSRTSSTVKPTTACIGPKQVEPDVQKPTTAFIGPKQVEPDVQKSKASGHKQGTGRNDSKTAHSIGKTNKEPTRQKRTASEVPAEGEEQDSKMTAANSKMDALSVPDDRKRSVSLPTLPNKGGSAWL